MRTEVEMNGIEWSVRQIKAALVPYRAINCERQSGKTTALMEWVHDRLDMYQMRIGFITHDWNMSRRVENEYNLRWPVYHYRSRDMTVRPSSEVLFVPGHELERLQWQNDYLEAEEKDR